MKCPECGFEGVLEGDKYCGKCGTALKIKTGSKWEKPEWKWGSMIVSLVLVYIFLESLMGRMPENPEFIFFFIIIGIPATIYIMYKERKQSLKYGPAWVLFPIIIIIVSYPYEYDFFNFFKFIIPAFIIDMIYVHKVEKRN